MNHEPKRYRKKPVVIEAMQWDGTEECQRAIVNWAKGAVSGWFDGEYFLEVHTKEGSMRANKDDFIIRGIKGEFYPHAGEFFFEAYDEEHLAPVMGAE